MPPGESSFSSDLESHPIHDQVSSESYLATGVEGGWARVRHESFALEPTCRARAGAGACGRTESKCQHYPSQGRKLVSKSKGSFCSLVAVAWGRPLCKPEEFHIGVETAPEGQGNCSEKHDIARCPVSSDGGAERSYQASKPKLIDFPIAYRGG